MTDRTNITYDLLSSDDVPRALEIERKGYPADEAASLEAFQFRQANAGKLFLGAYLTGAGNRELIGYVCGTLSPSESLTRQSMSEHIPSSASVCIHSVCVSEERRRTRIGLNLLKEYLSRLDAACQNGEPYRRVLLITHEHLRPFYQKVGFEWMGESDVVHGSEPWYEMRKTLGHDSSSVISEVTAQPEVHPEIQDIPAGLWEVLQRPTPTGPLASPFSTFPGGVSDLTEPHSRELNISVNKFDIMCPRSGCGSIILKNGVANCVERASVQMEPEGLPAQLTLPALPAPPATCHWWLITPSPMQFENIGFSRPVRSHDSPGPKLKFLACAECDLGPLGWCLEGGKEFWLACARVSYRT